VYGRGLTDLATAHGRTQEGELMDMSVLEQALIAAGIDKKQRYTLKETQLIIGTSIESLRRKLRDGSLKGQRFGKKWLFVYHDDLKNLLG